MIDNPEDRAAVSARPRYEVRRFYASVIFVIAVSCSFVAQAAPGYDSFAPSLRPPQAVVLYTHSSVRYTDFVEPLACLLRQVLRADVSTKSTGFPLGADLQASPTQFSVERLLPAFYSAAAHTDPPGTFAFLLVADDLKAEPFHYVFSSSDGSAKTLFHVGVLSIARLDPGSLISDPKERANTTALRAYKLILKAVARLSGYDTGEGCILAFPRSLDELDAKSAEFCPDDRDALVAAGMLKAKADKSCLLVSDLDEIKRNDD